LWLELLERGVEGGLVVEANERVFRSGVGGGGVECVGMVFEEDCAGGGDAGARSEEGVAEDAEDPGLEVGAGLKGVEGAESFGEGLLYEVFGLCVIAGEPVGVVIERWKEWERELLEICAAGGADGMVRNASMCLRFRGRGDTAKKTGKGWVSNILTVNRIAERLFHELFAGVWE
jgi:hypothetical protein